MPPTTLYCNTCAARFELRRNPGGLRVRCTACGGLLGTMPAPGGSARRRTRDPFLKKVVGGCRTTRRLSVGRLSICYHAIHQKHRMPVLLEVFPHDQPPYHEGRTIRLLRGLAAAAAIRHPNVVGILDLGRHPGYDYVVRELVDGGSVRALLERRGKLTPAVALPLAENVLRALSAGHSHGVRHGRISPDVILLDYDDRAKLEHFGRPLDEEELAEFTPTRSGGLAGPCVYVAPEQVHDWDAGGANVDLYSLGATLYEMLSGMAPFNGENAEEIMGARTKGAQPDLRVTDPQLPPELCDFVGRLMEPDPARRPADPSAALEDLKEVAVQLSRRPNVKEAPRTVDTERDRTRPRIRAALWTALAFALIAAAIIPLVLLWGERGKPEPVKAGAQSAAAAKDAAGVLIAFAPAGLSETEPPPEEMRRAVLALAAVQLSRLSALSPIDPMRSQDVIDAEAGLDGALLALNPAYLLRIGSSPGLGGHRWTLSLARLSGERWSMAKETATERGEEPLRALGNTLDELLADAAGRFDGAPYLPFASDPAGGQQMAAGMWELIGAAWAHERTGRMAQARAALEKAMAGGPRPAFALVLAAFCQAADSWERTGEIAFDAQWERDALWGEFARLADALVAVRDGDRNGALKALGRYLAEHPTSARGHFLLGMWRVRSESPPDEALAAFRRAIQVDPGYLPAARAVARLIAARSPEALRRFTDEYGRLAPGKKQEKALLEYCEQLRSGP